ncbi:sorbosone dehydrogenase family protein [Paenibacillus sp. UNC499MF]|uniref:PQQ-dependent sugar dehydrogenase n=1 Tax=Paenibacillus sp. UNC499MF TaxID=1502751 RepID=UPI00089FE79B|nr:PQQ-dependent sugar dehydrogenase [Paenibacillus sp. UNC499MF]SEG12653.1 Glucose/arabinose dehydrogenase, beta-propeller fold [Paenibacillus sp. UNC499MF]
MRQIGQTRVKSVLFTAAAAIAVMTAGCEGKPASTGGAVGGSAGTEAPGPANIGSTQESGSRNTPVVPKLTEQKAADYTQEILASGLNVPWELVIAPDGRQFFTERPGQLRMIRDGKLQEKPLLKLQDPFISSGEGGLLGLALDPGFAVNSYLYVYHTYSDGGETKNRVLRLKLQGDEARIDRVLIDGIPGAENHNGGRIKFGPDNMLYITTGEKYDPPLAQDKSSLGGKILRLKPDGSIPDDNPFQGSPVYSWGHRNAQGLAWDPRNGALLSSEHGQSAHDELNVIVPGGNYGWPLIEADETGSPEAAGPLIPPLLHSGRDTWAPSGMTFIRQGPWQGRLAVAGLRGMKLLLFTLEPEGAPASGAASSVPGYKLAKAEAAFDGSFGRLRSVTEGPDGSLYLLTSNRDGRGKPAGDDDKIVRLKPKRSGAE